MPYQQVNGANYYYEVHGAGEETIVFSHGFLWSGKMFEAQVAAFKDRYRVITYDHRGQGQTEVTRDGYDMNTLTDDACELIRALGAAPCHFVGLSMGGFVGMRLALKHPEMLKSLILLETSADPEPRENIPKYRILAIIARYLSFGLVTGRVMPLMFGKTFMTDPKRADERVEWQQEMEKIHPVGMYRALMGVINRDDIHHKLGAIDVPTLVMVGDEDVATVPAKAKRIHEGIRGSELVMITGAGHTSSVEQPDIVIDAMEMFLANLG